MTLPPDCRRARDRFADLLEGPADSEAAQHLAGCATCHREMSALRRTLDSLRDAEGTTEDPPASYWTDFNARVERRIGDAARVAGRRGAGRPGGPSGTGFLARAAGLVLLVAAGLMALLQPVPRRDDGIAHAQARLDQALQALDDFEIEEAVRVARLALEDVVGSSGAVEIMPAGDVEEWIEALDEAVPATSFEMWSPAPFELEDLDEAQARRLLDALVGDPC